MAQKLRPQAETLSGSPQPNFVAYTPAAIISKRSPTVNDTGYPLGQVWVNKVASDVYALASVAAGSATWNLAASSAGALSTLTGNSGGALNPSAGNISIVGTGALGIAGSGSTLTASITPGTSLVATVTGGTGGALSPASGNITLAGTANQITSTGSGSTVTFSLPSALTVPGSLTTTTTLTVGTKLDVTTGANASAGVSAALTGGTVTVSTTAVTANSLIFFSANTLGTVTVPSAYYASAKTAGTSFVITASQATDTSTVNWWLIN